MSKRLTNLAALRQIGFTANRRLLGVQRISHDPIRGAQAFTDLTSPIITSTGTRIPALRFGNPRVHALLQALLIHRLLPNGFTNRDLRAVVATLLGTTIEDISAGKMTYDLRRLRVHGLIERIPKSRRYQVTDAGCATRCCSPTPTTTCYELPWQNSSIPHRPGRRNCAPRPTHTKPRSTSSPVRRTWPPDRNPARIQGDLESTVDSKMTAPPSKPSK